MMHDVRRKLTRRNALVIGIAAAALASLSLAGSAGAAAPPSGINCQADGKITGRGATFQNKAQTAFIAGFTGDVCGIQADSVTINGVTSTNNNMVIYNTDGLINGSGNGRNSQSCRTDAFGGTDIPSSAPI